MSTETEVEICEWCGMKIEDPDQQCYARDDGWTCDADPYDVE